MALSNRFKAFRDVLGQERAITFLKRVIGSEKIPHAYLFTGISGVGKTTTAMAFAQAINCDAPLEREGCGRCLSCRQMLSGNFPDLISIEPEGRNIKIEQIRELNRKLNFKPAVGKYRISIIHSSELMTEEASNSFLKALEEPPPGNVMILKVVEPLDLPDTIVSRCQKVHFRPLPYEIIKKWLRDEQAMDEEKSSLIAAISEGSLGTAVHILQSDFMEERQDFLFKIIQLLNLPKEEVLDAAMKYAGKIKRTESIPEGKEISLYDLMGIWKTWYRDLILMKVDGPMNLLINTDFSRKMKTVLKKMNTADLIDGFFMVDQAQRDLMKNPNAGLMMEKLFLDLRALSPVPA